MKKVLSLFAIAALFTISGAEVAEKNFSPELQQSLRIRQGAFDTVSDLYLITAPDGTRTLIDGGLGIHRGKKYYEQVLFKILAEQKITRLDQIIISHVHKDHFGSIPYLLKRSDIAIGKVCWSYLPPETILASEPKWESKADQQAVIDLCKKRNIPLIDLKKGDIISFGSGITATVLSTGARNAKRNYLNNQSLVFKLQYGKFSMLFTGDCGFEQEKELLKEYGSQLKSTILKCAHHGGSGSTGTAFLRAVSPQLAVSPMPRWLSQRRQGQEVETRLNAQKIPLVRSWEHPGLSIVSNGETFELVKIVY